MYYCEIHNNVLRDRERMYVDMLFKHGADRGGGELIHLRGAFMTSRCQLTSSRLKQELCLGFFIARES